MKKYLLGISVITLLVSGHVQAADIVQDHDVSEIASPVIDKPAFNWGGGYIGGQLGSSWSVTNASMYVRHEDSTIGTLNLATNVEGFLGGIYAGYNFDLGKNMFVGLETDFIWNNADSIKFSGGKLFPSYAGTMQVQGKIGQKWAHTTRLRVGYPLDRFLPYVAAGVAYGEVKSRLNGWVEDNQSAKIPDSDYEGSDKDIFTGWTLGTGIDYTFTDNVLLRLEYRYADYGDKSYKIDLSTNDSLIYNVEHKTHDMRVGVAYKF